MFPVNCYNKFFSLSCRFCSFSGFETLRPDFSTHQRDAATWRPLYWTFNGCVSLFVVFSIQLNAIFYHNNPVSNRNTFIYFYFLTASKLWVTNKPLTLNAHKSAMICCLYSMLIVFYLSAKMHSRQPFHPKIAKVSTDTSTVTTVPCCQITRH